MRLNKYIASSGITSRRKADELISSGKVLVNGKRAKLGMSIDSTKNTVKVMGKIVSLEETFKYYALNKPIGVISTAKDNMGRKTVLDFVKSKKRLFPVGRLDADSEGLIIITNDGELANIITHPSHELKKTYRVTTREKISEVQIEKLEKGIHLKGGMTSPAKVKIIDKNLFEIEITEGRNRQVRRMAGAVGLSIENLKRIQIGPIKLDNLKTGKVRVLLLDEVNTLKTKT